MLLDRATGCGVMEERVTVLECCSSFQVRPMEVSTLSRETVRVPGCLRAPKQCPCAGSPLLNFRSSTSATERQRWPPRTSGATACPANRSRPSRRTSITQPGGYDPAPKRLPPSNPVVCEGNGQRHPHGMLCDSKLLASTRDPDLVGQACVKPNRWQRY